MIFSCLFMFSVLYYNFQFHVPNNTCEFYDIGEDKYYMWIALKQQKKKHFIFIS